MRAATTLLTILLASASLSTGAAAQEPGTRLSVLVPHPFEGSSRQTGLLERVTGDTIWVRIDDRSTALNVQQARPRVPGGGTYGRRGAVIGSLVGAAIGGLVGHQGYLAPERSCSPGGTSMLFGSYGPSCSGGYDSAAHAVEVAGGAVGGALVGLFGGWALGSMIERWTPLNVDTGMTLDGRVAVKVGR